MHRIFCLIYLEEYGRKLRGKQKMGEGGGSTFMLYYRKLQGWSTEPRRSRHCPFFYFIRSFCFSYPFYFAAVRISQEMGFPWETEREPGFPSGMAKYEIVRRCSHRRKTSVGYWGRDYPMYIRIHAYMRVCRYHSFWYLARYQRCINGSSSMKVW